MSYRFDKNLVTRVVVVTYEGPYTDNDLVDSYYDYKAYRAQHPPSHVILDFTEVTDIIVSYEAIQTHALVPPTVPLGYYLIAVAPRPAMHSIARLFELMAHDRPNIVVVNTLRQALLLVSKGQTAMVA